MRTLNTFIYVFIHFHFMYCFDVTQDIADTVSREKFITCTFYEFVVINKCVVHNKILNIYENDDIDVNYCINKNYNYVVFVFYLCHVIVNVNDNLLKLFLCTNM